MGYKKLLALAMDVENAPPQLRQAAAAARNAYFRVEKCKDQVLKWNEEGARAKRDLDRSMRIFDQLLSRWDAADVEGSGPEELVREPAE